jgi:cation transport regulator ChaC
MAEIYFAYGSNIDAVEVDGREARSLGMARLDDHRLAFTRRSVRTGTGVADVISAQGEVVWGVLYELEPDQAAALDAKEGLGWAYVRVSRHVRTPDGEDVDVFLYTVLHKEREEVPPSDAYLARLLHGARRHGLPADYVRALERLRVRPCRSGP